MDEISLQRQQEVEVVTTAYFLEKNISDLKKENARLYRNRPAEPLPPPEPKLKKELAAAIPYPNITTQVNFAEKTVGYFKNLNKKLILVCIAIMVLSIVADIQVIAYLTLLVLLMYIFMKRITWLFWGKSKVKEQKEEQIRNSPKYQARCREIDEENRKRQEDLNQALYEKYLKECEDHKALLVRHTEELKHYREEVLPAWSEKVSALEKDINDTQAALQELYSRRVIPAQYHDIPSLYYLATFIGTSNYDLKFAIERYDAYVARLIEKEKMEIEKAKIAILNEISSNQQYANWLNEQMLGMLEQGNATLRSINSWQKADLAARTYWRYKDRREQRGKK